MANLLKSAATQRLTKKAQKEKNFAAISGLEGEGSSRLALTENIFWRKLEEITKYLTEK